MIGIIDYGMGNLRSVQKGFESQGLDALVTADRELLRRADGLVLPGVGAFPDAMANIRREGLDTLIREQVGAGKPLLGICLGLQLLFEYSEEKGYTEGLGFFAGGVKRLHTGLKIPHMGWNEMEIHRPSDLIDGVTEGTFTYFVHSYHVVPEDRDLIVATCDYDQEIVGIAGRDRVHGIQFHPEKSSAMGLKILSNFAKVVNAS